MPFSYKDLADLPEDDRIKQIGEHVIRTGQTVAVCTDDEPGKPERYVTKIKKRFPGVRVLEQKPGPFRGVVTIRVGPATE